MKFTNGLVVVEAPLRGDTERRRWYAGGGKTCVVLTTSGELLEPTPTYGPSLYRVIGSQVDLLEAEKYAAERGFTHPRTVDAS